MDNIYGRFASFLKNYESKVQEKKSKVFTCNGKKYEQETLF